MVKTTTKVLSIAHRKENVYTMDFTDLAIQNVRRFPSNWLWHQRLEYASIELIRKLSRNEYVYGMPKLQFEKDHLCDVCQMDEQIRIYFKPKNMISTLKFLTAIAHGYWSN